MPGHLKLFGVPALTHAGETVPTPPDLPLLLLAYAATSEDGVSRSEMVGRFWPEEEERVGRHNLSQLLYRHRKAVWRPLLEAEPGSLRWLGSCDVTEFRTAMAAGDWSAASTHRASAFLSGVRADQNAGASIWLEEERRTYSSQWRNACLQASRLAEPDAALELLQALLDHDPLDEESVQAHMRAALKVGNYALAQHTFTEFSRHLDREMGVEPLPVTAQLASEARSLPRDGTVRQDESEATPFVGREIELAQIVSAFQPQSAQPARLLSICGPGGMGKSRLARRAGMQLKSAFPHGVMFVPLAPLASAFELPRGLADALGLHPEADIRAAVLDSLRSRTMLIILDNFEHVTAAADFVATLLKEAPGVSVMTTTREPLGLQAEEVFVLAGLDYPADTDDPQAASFEAVRLFASTARRHGETTTGSSPESMSGTVKVCQLLRGLPLGIVLAASWTRLLSPNELAAELAADIDLLQSSHLDAEPRHQSLRAVFNGSWELLDALHRTVLAGLSVFRGTFDLAAARAVTGAPIRTLLGLVTRSLVEQRPDGRFEMHEAIRQYAHEQLGEQVLELRRSHAAWFMELAVSADSHLTGQGQQEWLERLAADHDNLAAANRFFVEAGDVEDGLRCANAQFWYWHIRGHYREGSRTYDVLLARGRDVNEAVLARAFHCSGSLHASLAEFKTARERTLSALAHHERLEDGRGIALAHWQLGTILRDTGELETARSHLKQAQRLQEEGRDEFNLSTTYNDMAIVTVMAGKYDEAEALFQNSLALKRKLGDKQGVSYALSNLALLADERGDDPVIIRSGLLEALRIKRDLDDQRGIINSLYNLSLLGLREGDLRQSARYVSEGIDRSQSLGNVRQTLELCAAAAQVIQAAGHDRDAVKLAAGTASLWSQNALSTTTDLPPGVATVLAETRLRLDRAAFTDAEQAGSGLDFSELLMLVRELMAEEAPTANGNGGAAG